MNEKNFMEQIKSTTDNIIIYGAGMVGELVLKRLQTYIPDDRIFGFAVTKVGKSNAQCLGKPIYEIEELKSYADSSVVIIATMPELHNEIEKTLKNLHFYHVCKVTKELFLSLSEAYIKEFRKNNQLENQDIDVVFMASDNNSSSGAFLCMAELNTVLNENGIKTLIVLPEYGNGERVLKKKHLLYTYIPSKNWVLPYSEQTEHTGCLIEKQNESALNALEVLFLKHHVRLVHNNTTYTYIGAVAAKKCNIPVVWHLREDVLVQGCDFVDRKKALEFINQSNQVIVVSKFIESCIKGLESEKVNVIYDGVDTERYYFEKEILNKQNEITITMVGAITPIKGQKELIEAVHLLKERGLYNFKILFIGKGDKDYLDELSSLIDTYQLEKNIEFLGRKENVSQFYQKSDIAVVCSQADSFGRTTVEGQLSGNVVIGADAGATPELIENGKTGLLYEYGNAADLADKIQYAIENQSHARRMAKRGQKQAAELYTKERNAVEIMKVYQDLTKSRK